MLGISKEAKTNSQIKFSSEHTSGDQLEKTYIHQLCTNTEYHVEEDFSRMINNKYGCWKSKEPVISESLNDDDINDNRYFH